MAVIGTGIVGQALGKAWAANVHEIVFGAQEPGLIGFR